MDPKGDGRYLLSNSKDQTAKLWDLRAMLSPTDHHRLGPPQLPPLRWCVQETLLAKKVPPFPYHECDLTYIALAFWPMSSSAANHAFARL